MKYIYKDLGQRRAGERVRVSLSNWANVRLMNSSNYSNYKSGRNHQYHGGLYKKTPVTLQIPTNGRWYVTVDNQGLANPVRATIEILPGALPEARPLPLAETPSLFHEPSPPSPDSDKQTYDVFISHASEDKDEVVRPLVNALKDNGLEVWFDELTLKIGDSLRQKIDRGISSSRVALVVLSPSFLTKGWTNHELDGIVTRSVSGEQILLPIWHNLTKQEVMDFSPSIADKVARSTATHTVVEIAAEIAELISSQ